MRPSNRVARSLRSHPLHSRIVLAWLPAVLLAAAARADIAPYMPKPATWKSYLIDKDQQAITDVEFAQWVANAQGGAAALTQPCTFRTIFTFTQCYAGGFLDELNKNAAAGDFGSNSSCRYFEGASYIIGNPVHSYYGLAWAAAVSQAPGMDDRQITEAAHAALGDGDEAVPDNPRRDYEHPQYLKRGAGMPQPLGADPDFNYAILYVGMPDERDQNDLTYVYETLIDSYGYSADDVLVIYGDGLDPDPNDSWEPDQAATRANLRAAWESWIVNKLDAQAPPHNTAQVLFWAGDHGGVQAPIAISVACGSMGQPGTSVNDLLNAGQPVCSWAYEAGSGSNVKAWMEPSLQHIDAIAFGNDFQAIDFSEKKGITYFSVDKQSLGRLGSDVRRERKAGRSPAPDVFVQSGGQLPNAPEGTPPSWSNRLMIDGGRDLGLLEPPLMEDELESLSMRNILTIADTDNNTLSKTLFYSVDGSSEIYVADPQQDGEVYVYYDFMDVMRQNPNDDPDDPDDDMIPDPPQNLDALALLDNCARRLRNPDQPEGPDNPMDLYFDTNADRMLFSLGRTEDPTSPNWGGYLPCDIIRRGPGVGAASDLWQHCSQLGLRTGADDPDDPDDNGLTTADNLDALDLGAGIEGKPIIYQKADADPGANILFNTGPHRPLTFNGAPGVLVGYGSGKLNVQNPQLWRAMAFTLPAPPPGVDAWRITRLAVAGFTPLSQAPDNDLMHYIIWSRDGSDCPLDGDQIVEGTVPFPAPGDDPDYEGSDDDLHAIDVDFTLPPGDYSLTVYAESLEGNTANFAWFANPDDGINLLEPDGSSYQCRSNAFPFPGFYNFTNPNIVQSPGLDPNDAYNARFLIHGVPAACDAPSPCPADTNGDHVVDVQDLVMVIVNWGATGGSPADVNGDGAVSVEDLVAVLIAWGVCP